MGALIRTSPVLNNKIMSSTRRNYYISFLVPVARRVSLYPRLIRFFFFEKSFPEETVTHQALTKAALSFNFPYRNGLFGVSVMDERLYDNTSQNGTTNFQLLLFSQQLV